MTSIRYYDLNDRTIQLFMKGDINMSAVTDNDTDDNSKESDAETQHLLDTETDDESFVVDTNKRRADVTVSFL